ncbi:wnt inhibitory factor 1-like [Phaenicophaeus curvirostris]|uniref:wnt inhibitory factor 1-like n=1 Tax=Phaenicophaeus curvirostris TaxID=33595 RepID=UPI0037F0CD2F
MELWASPDLRPVTGSRVPDSRLFIHVWRLENRPYEEWLREPEFFSLEKRRQKYAKVNTGQKSFSLNSVESTCYPKCKNGRECLRPGNCRCSPGCEGRYCHKVSCAGGCQNGGECISVNGVGKCLCASGWTGSRCREAICPKGCRNNGACVAPGICSCPAGWVGGGCHLAVCKLRCQHGGECTAPNVCRCQLPHSGPHCAKKRKERSNFSKDKLYFLHVTLHIEMKSAAVGDLKKNHGN